ncbi:MAG TPA: restriction endonuclease [Lysobacter sp.]|nr:restriction endonuclease [Lysobacter sp.]
MMNWRQLQDSTAKLFRELGCEAAVEAMVEGARAVHELDVQVKFRQFGIETTWVIECKSWRRNVTKEKVMALKAIIEDVGADRGVIVSASGFQAGAIRAAATSNITLTDWKGSAR